MLKKLLLILLIIHCSEAWSQDLKMIRSVHSKSASSSLVHQNSSMYRVQSCTGQKTSIRTARTSSLRVHQGFIQPFAYQTSSGQIENHDLQLYPNPCQDYLNIEILESNKLQGSYELEILDMAGRVIRQFTMNFDHSNQLNTSDLLAGQYIIYIKNKEEWYRGNFQKLY